MKQLLDWIGNRTGAGDLLRAGLYENIPGGARWRYVWGSTLVLTFFTQLITGMFLWMAYSPSTQTAWESVYYIEHQMQGGSLLRGIHHFTASAMVVLLALHLMQVVIDGAYRAPREFNFWIGLILMLLVLGLALTGYLLPWDQKGFWATSVATNLTGLAPGGEAVRQLAIGGTNYGHHTLTRFFALHAGLLPALLMFFLVLHLALFRRHGITAHRAKDRAAATLWPDQALKDGVACLAVLAVVVGLALWQKAELGAPADPASPYAAARPEWYFLFLFQMLKHFTGAQEFIGAIFIPALVVLVLFLMPLVGRWRLGHRFNAAFLLTLFGAAGFLTYQALHEDYYATWHNVEESQLAGDEKAIQRHRDRLAASRDFLSARHEARLEAERAIALAGSPRKIPPTGALSMLRADIKAQGRRLFRDHCTQCHAFSGTDTNRNMYVARPSASNLYGFATRQWIAGLLDPQRIDGDHYFGLTAHKDGEMVEWVKENIGEVDEEDRAGVMAEVELVAAALSAQAKLKVQAEQDQRDAEKIAQGEALLKDDFACIECHRFGGEGEREGPDLTGYGSWEWLVAFISSPEHERFYPETNDRMPSFAEHLDQPQRNTLTQEQIGILADWLRSEW